MKKEKVLETIKSEVESGNTDKNKIAGILLNAGASLAQAQRIIPKALIELGVAEPVVRVSNEDVKAVKKACTKKALNAIETYGDLKTFVEEVLSANELDITEEKALKVVREQAKEKEVELPSKINLGKQKIAIVDYFTLTDPKDHSLKNLAEYVQKALDIEAEKALHIARMNYGFAYMLFNRLETFENC